MVYSFWICSSAKSAQILSPYCWTHQLTFYFPIIHSTVQCSAVHAVSVMSESLWPHGLEPTRFLHPWNSPGKNRGVGCHFLLQGIFLTQGLSLHLFHLLHCQTGSLPVAIWEATDLGTKWFICCCMMMMIWMIFVPQSCPTLFDPMDWSPPYSSVHGIFQARILKRATFHFSRGYSQPRDQTLISYIAGRFFTIWATREALFVYATDILWLLLNIAL